MTRRRRRRRRPRLLRRQTPRERKKAPRPSFVGRRKVSPRELHVVRTLLCTQENTRTEHTRTDATPLCGEARGRERLRQRRTYPPAPLDSTNVISCPAQFHASPWLGCLVRRTWRVSRDATVTVINRRPAAGPEGRGQALVRWPPKKGEIIACARGRPLTRGRPSSAGQIAHSCSH